MKIYKFTLTDKLNLSIKIIRKHGWDAAQRQLEFIGASEIKHVRELRKLRRPIKGGGTEYTFVVTGKYFKGEINGDK